MIIYWDKKTNSKNRIGQRVKELRKAHNLTQKTLAAKLQLAGYDFNDLAILRIEQGTRFFQMLSHWPKYLMFVSKSSSWSDGFSRQNNCILYCCPALC